MQKLVPACESAHACGFVAGRRRHVYVTPKSYMSFLDGFRALYTSKLTETRELAGAINNGLDKMNGAKVDVNRMKVSMPVHILPKKLRGRTILCGILAGHASDEHKQLEMTVCGFAVGGRLDCLSEIHSLLLVCPAEVYLQGLA